MWSHVKVLHHLVVNVWLVVFLDLHFSRQNQAVKLASIHVCPDGDLLTSAVVGDIIKFTLFLHK